MLSYRSLFFFFLFCRCSRVVRSPSSPVWPTCLTASPRRRRKLESFLPRNSSHAWEKKMVGIVAVGYYFIRRERGVFPFWTKYWNIHVEMQKVFRLLIFGEFFHAQLLLLTQNLMACFPVFFSGKHLSVTRCSEIILKCYFFGYLLRPTPCQQEVYQLVSEA